MRVCSLALLLSIAVGCARPTVVTIANGGSAPDAALRQHVLAGLEAHLQSCHFNSVADADWIEHPAELLAERWAATVAGPHLGVHYGRRRVFETVGGPVSVRRIALELAPDFPGWFGTRTADEVISYEKCSGTQLLEFICSPALRERMPAGYRSHCQELESWRADQAETGS